MRTWAKGTSRAAVLTASFVALGVSAIPANAFADTTNGTGGALSGNQVDVPISAPVDVSGNAAGLLGTGYATSHGGVKVHKRGGGGQQTSGAHGVASGNQVNAPISLPVNVCGNGAAVLGEADAGCRGGAKINDSGEGGQTTDGTGGVLAGNQVNAPISIPVNVCGNAVAVAGDSVGGCEGGALVKSGGDTGSGQETSGIFGVGAGNQANAPISIPVTACGNAAALAGQASAFCEGGAHARSGSGGDQHTSGAAGILAGNQGNAPISIPAEVCGNAAAVVGLAAASCNGQTLVEGSHGSGAQTSGDHCIGSGNQTNTPVENPADVCGNAAAIVGLASALCEDGSGYGGYHPYSRTTGEGLPQGTGLPKVDGLPSTKTALPRVNGVGSARRGEAALPGAEIVQQLGKTTGDGASLGDGTAPAAVSMLDTEALPGGTGLPKLNGQPTLTNSGGVDGLTSDGLQALPQTGGANGLPKLVALPKARALPVKDGQRASGGVDGVAPNGLNALPKTKGLSDLVSMPGMPVLPAESGRRAPGGVDGVASKGLSALPGTNGVTAVGGGSEPVALPRTPSLPQNLLPQGRGVTELGGLSKVVALPTAPVVPVKDARRTGSGGHQVSGLSLVNGMPVVDGVPQVSGRRADVPATGGLTKVRVPHTNGLSKIGLSSVGGRPVASVLSQHGSAARTHGTLPLPKVAGLTDGQALPATPGGALPATAEGALPATADGALTATDGQVLPVTPGRALPVTTGGALPVTGKPAGDVVPVTGAIGPVKEVAAQETIADGANTGALWAMVAAGMLAAASGVLALTRRIRAGRR
jgi:hypothetical protein